MRPSHLLRRASLLFGASFVLVPVTLAQNAFTEESALRGISFHTASANMFGRGVALLDLDADGDPDLVAMGEAGGACAVFENDGTGNFADNGPSGLPAMPDASGLIAADFDGDGLPDLFVSRWGGTGTLLWNQGGLTFVDGTAAAGIGLQQPGNGAGCAAGDVNGDGWIDIYLANYEDETQTLSRNFLFVNLGDGTFVERAANFGLDYSGYTYQAVMLDYDDDGDCDMYLSNDNKGQPGCAQLNRLMRNDGSTTFTDVSAATNTDICIDSMGVAVGDFSSDGKLDIYCTNTQAGHVLLESQPGDTFVDSTVATGTEAFAIGWGALFFDYDNDGFDELYVCHIGPNFLYDCDGTYPCDEIGAQMNVDVGLASFCAAQGDVDLDGDLDLVVQSWGDDLRLFMNKEGHTREHARLRVEGRGPNTSAIGAVVRVRTGGTWQRTDVFSGTTFKSQDELERTVGLGSATVMDEITVDWPDGHARQLTNYPAGETWVLYPDERLGDADADGDCDPADLALLAAAFAPGAPLLPGSEIFDMDGNGEVGFGDVPPFVARYTGPAGDCDGNGRAEVIDIAIGAHADTDADGVPDICACNVTTICQGGVNSLGAGATLTANNTPSMSGPPLSLTGAGMPSTQIVAPLVGTPGTGQPFGGGTLCADFPVYRMATVNADAAGVLNLDLSPDASFLPPGLIQAGSTWILQFPYRDPGGPGGFNLTDGLSVTWCP